MSALRRSTALPLFAVLTIACGAPPAPLSATPPAPVVAEKDKSPDLSSVPEPPGLIVLARVKDPNAIVSAVGSWAKFPLPIGSALVQSITDEQVADVVDLSQPVDLAVSVDASRHRVDPIVAFSFSAGAFEEAKAKLGARYRLVAETNGALRVVGLGQRTDPSSEDFEEEDESDDGCVLAPAVRGARLVCGNGAGLESLTPYLSRTMPRESWPGDIHVEIRPEPVRAPLTELRATIPVLARSMLGGQSAAVRDFVDASIGEIVDIVNDMQKLTIDAHVKEDGIIATTQIDLRSRASTFARMLATTELGPAPAAFTRLPPDADMAWFAREGDPATYDRTREILSKLLLDVAGANELPAADQSAFEELVGDRTFRLFTNGTRIYAKGFDPKAVERAIAAKKSVKPGDASAADEAERALAAQVVGWHLYQVSEPIAKVGPILKDWAALVRRPAFAKWAAAKGATFGVRVAPMPAGAKLPKESVHVEVTIPVGKRERDKGDKAKPRRPVAVHVFAVPDGAATWLAFGLDPKLVTQKVASSLSTAEASTPNAGAPRHAALQGEKLAGGGMLTLRGLAVLGALADASERGLFAKLEFTPHRGTTPIAFTSTSESSSGSEAASFVGSMHLPRTAIEDIVKLATLAR